MNKRLFLNIFLTSLFLIAISLLVYDLKIHTGRKSECVQGPLIYGAIQLKEINKAEFSCSCSLEKPNSPTIFFNSYGMNVEYPKGKRAEININFSEWEEKISTP